MKTPRWLAEDGSCLECGLPFDSEDSHLEHIHKDIQAMIAGAERNRWQRVRDGVQARMLEKTQPAPDQRAGH